MRGSPSTASLSVRRPFEASATAWTVAANRQRNAALYRIAITQARYEGAARE
jgi:hypothetical protein